jgi:myo-inositol-1(or 4)-monophosphatase
MILNLEQINQQAMVFARKAGDHTLTYFRNKVSVEFKGDQSPVTVADREAEMILRQCIQEAYPDHGIIGEEYGTHQPEARVTWVLDPIDGTQSFIHGIPLYTTLIGIIVDQQPVIGIIYAPAMNEMVDAIKGMGARLNDAQIQVSKVETLADATVLTTDIRNVARYGFKNVHDTLVDQCKVHRTWGDAYGHLMVACGRADIMVDPILNLWDAVPLMTILPEAGGVFIDKKGNETEFAGHGISTNRRLKPQLTAMFD